MNRLQDRLYGKIEESKPYLGMHSGIEPRVSVAVIDVESGQTVGVDMDRVQPSSSLIKVPIMQVALMQREFTSLSYSGNFRMDDRNGKLDGLKKGDEVSKFDLLVYMVQDSDSEAADELVQRMMIDKVNEGFQQVGLESTRFSDFFFPGCNYVQNLTTPIDMARTMANISKTESRFMRSLLQYEDNNHVYVKKGLMNNPDEDNSYSGMSAFVELRDIR